MFEDSLLESTGRLHTRDRRPAMLAFALQATLAAAVILLPALHPEVVPIPALSPTLFAPVPPKPPVPPVRVRVETRSASSATAPVAEFREQVTRSATGVNLHPTALPEPSDVLATTVNLGSGTGIPDAIANSSETTGPNVVVAARPGPARPVAVSTGVSAGLLLGPIRPVYPVIAKASHTQGTVEVHAILSRSGRVESATVVSGPSMLAGAALQAIRAARYRPYLLNGQPTEVETTFYVNFRLNE